MSTAVVLDTETTGFGDDDRVIELCIVRWSDGEVLFHQHFNPGRTLSSDIVKITGITDEFLADKPSFREHVLTIIDLLEPAEAVVGYNPAFDRRMLDAEFVRSSMKITWPTLVCAKRTWDVCEPRPDRGLQNAYRRFVDPAGFEGAHGARADALATRDVLRAQFDAFALHDTPWNQLDPDYRTRWGTSSHVKLVDGVLIVNFGKHIGRPVVEVDTGFWAWVTKKDFPDHVLLLGIKMIEFSNKYRGEALRNVLTEWAIAHQEKMR